MPANFKDRMFQIIQIGNRTDIPSRIFDYVISLLILCIIGITYALTFKLDETTQKILETAEIVITCIFGAEYILRLWTSDLLYKNKPVIRFIFSFNGIIDLLTILAFFIPAYSGFVALRLVRVLRVLRLFQVNKGFDAFHVISAVLKNKKNQLLSSMTMVLMLILMASLSMYSFEHEAQPEIFANGFSGIWWAVSAILTVGYGDIYPITLGGEIAAICISLLGVCAVAIPTGIISAGFVEYYTKLDSGQGIKPELIEQAKRKNVDINAVLSDYLKKH